MKLQVIKIIIATGLALAMAEFLGLENASSAGIVAMLSVLDTRKSSLKIAWQRLFSTVVALLLGTMSLGFLGFNIYGFLLYLSLFVVFAYILDVKVAIAPCSVLVTHLWIAEDLSFSFLGNEFLLMLLGTGMAILLQTYMPSRQATILSMRQDVEDQLRGVLSDLSHFLYEGKSLSQTQNLLKLETLMNKAQKTVYQEMENQLFSQTDYDWHYFNMREAQLQLLKTIDKNLQGCQLAVAEAKLLGSLFDLTANQLSEHNPATYLLEDIEAMLKHFRERDLPKSRQEFEMRAILFQVLTDLRLSLIHI